MTVPPNSAAQTTHVTLPNKLFISSSPEVNDVDAKLYQTVIKFIPTI